MLVGVDFGRTRASTPRWTNWRCWRSRPATSPWRRVVARRKAPDAALFVGSGKADEIKALVLSTGAQGVIFDQALSPAQQRNLERHLGVPVADRTGVILDIFAARAQSHEGKLQVELARLQYLATRLVRRWSHLERQSGGIGLRGGPGEAQIELDRRMIGERIKSVKERLEKVKRQRGTQRKARERRGTFRISLVGYTNAGKSTLFNALVKARALRGRPAVRDARHHDARAVAVGRGGARCRCPTPSASSATCRTSWSRPSRPRCRRRPMPTCCCTWSTRRARCGSSRCAEVERVLDEIGAGAGAAGAGLQQVRPARGVAPPRAAARLGRARQRPCACAACLRQRARRQGIDVLRQVLADAVRPALERRRRAPIYAPLIRARFR